MPPVYEERVRVLYVTIRSPEQLLRRAGAYRLPQRPASLSAQFVYDRGRLLTVEL